MSLFGLKVFHFVDAGLSLAAALRCTTVAVVVIVDPQGHLLLNMK